MSSMNSFNTEARKLALQGVTLVASSGDNGAAGDESLCNADSSSNSVLWGVSALLLLGLGHCFKTNYVVMFFVPKSFPVERCCLFCFFLTWILALPRTSPQGHAWSGKGYFPSFPATSPYVTAVGGTQGPDTGDKEIAAQSQEGGVITTGELLELIHLFVGF